MSVLTPDRSTRVTKAKQRNAEARQDPVREQPIIADYLCGKISCRRFTGIVGEKTVHAIWDRLAVSIQELRPRAKQRPRKASQEDESTSLAIMGVANSFLLWNLPDSYGAGPLERVRVVDSSVWVFPIVLTSPGYGIVGEVGHIAVDSQKAQIVGCTPLDTVQLRGKKCYGRHKEKIEAAFLQARRA
jgi:hypothetical protein